MTRGRIIRLILLVSIVIGAQLYVNCWPADVIAVSATDGPIFGIVKHADTGGTAVFRWSADLSTRDLLWENRHPTVKGIRSTRDGSTVVIANAHGVTCYDVATRRTNGA